MTSPPPPSPGVVEPPNAPNVRNDESLHPLEDGPSDMEEEEEEQAETPARMSTHHNFTLEKIACPMCGKVYKRGHGIKLHFRRIHGARIDDDMLFGVSDGTAASTSPPNPRPTAGDSVPREGHFVCCMCSEVFGRAEDLQEHERVHAKATSPTVHAAGLRSVGGFYDGVRFCTCASACLCTRTAHAVHALCINHLNQSSLLYPQISISRTHDPPPFWLPSPAVSNQSRARGRMMPVRLLRPRW